jgi:serine phosphatase RsbU (regulator of sigma subunit)
MNKTKVMVADVTGHGVSAAMDSSTVKIAFRNEKQWMNSPEKLLENMNQFLTETLDQRFVSAVYAFLDLQTMEMQYATAGHPPIFLIRENNINILDSEGFLLGFIRNCEYTLFTHKLKKGDKLLFYTDGLNDDISIDFTPAEVLKETMQGLAYTSAERYTKDLISELNKKRVRTSDDITLLLIDLT